MDRSSTTANRMRISNPRHLARTVGIFAAALIAIFIFIFLFMMNTASSNLIELITAQQHAAQRPCANLVYYKHQRAGTEPARTTLPPGLFESLVRFSATNATTVKPVHRLTPLRVLASN